MAHSITERVLEKNIPYSPPEMAERVAEIHFHHLAEHEAKDDRRHVEAKFAQKVADDTDAKT